MPTHDERLAALEKDAATMKRDIIYKLDDTNHAVTIIRGLVDNEERDIRDIKSDIREIKSDVGSVTARLDGVNTRLEGLKGEIRSIKDLQNGQGQDITNIKRRLDTLEEKFDQRFDKIEGEMGAMENRILDAFQQLVTIIDTRLPQQEK
ncbi:MAG: hypothetical protein H0V70_27620 [Ktedonobacteraceae bacterium]|nr:hypothetical protein [Ktedonobacteraceae bacterium]